MGVLPRRSQRPSQRPGQGPSQGPGQRPSQRPSQQPSERPGQRPSQQSSQQPSLRRSHGWGALFEHKFKILVCSLIKSSSLLSLRRRSCHVCCHSATQCHLLLLCLSSLTSRLLKILQLVIKFPLQAQGVGLFRFSLGLWHSLRTKYNLLPFLARW